jgi:5-enolpyruvylshikimate-3-phosphate synthase
MSAGKRVHGDHRIAMAAAAVGPTMVRSGGSPRTSYPEFVDMLKQLGNKSEQVEP